MLGDFLRILLEVSNCILSLNLLRNPELVYALLHKQEVFEQLRSQPGCTELVDNLQVGGGYSGRLAGWLSGLRRAACVRIDRQYPYLVGSCCRSAVAAVVISFWTFLCGCSKQAYLHPQVPDPGFCHGAAVVCNDHPASQAVIDFFNNRLDSVKGNTAAAPEGQADWSVNRVLELVQTFAQVNAGGP